MKNLLAFVILLIQFSSTSVHAQAYLQVSDPRYSWYSYQGTIEAATLSVKPKGI
jgi:hypothetical protein